MTKTPQMQGFHGERKTGFEPATLSLGSSKPLMINYCKINILHL